MEHRPQLVEHLDPLPGLLHHEYPPVVVNLHCHRSSEYLLSFQSLADLPRVPLIRVGVIWVLPYLEIVASPVILERV